MGFAIALLVLTLFAMALLLAPMLLRQRPDQSSEAYNLAVYRDQLAELDRDVGRGVLSGEEAESARAEISRRILALSPGAAPRTGSRASLATVAAAVLLLPVAAWTVYWQLGSPSVPDEPFASRRAQASVTTSAANPHADMAGAVAKLSAHLREHPDDIAGWMLMGRSQIDLGRYHDAADAYRRAADLSNQRPDIVGDWAEALVMSAGGTVTPDAKKAFEEALKDPESAPRSRYYLALTDLQQGDAKGALKGWVDLEADSPPNAEWLPLLRQRIAETAKAQGIDPATLKTSAGKERAAAPSQSRAEGVAPAAVGTVPTGAPSRAQVEATARATAAATPEQREAMIRGMVANLAAKLEKNPDDVDGWARLGRSYMVLGDPAKAADAYGRAVKLRPGDAALKTAFDEATAAARK